ncbi:MAG TPA: hypothetical protein VJ904_06080, partial [Tichowtungia sp.]|nr:hypothetical protein [Tichowtungia sp.]
MKKLLLLLMGWAVALQGFGFGFSDVIKWNLVRGSELDATDARIDDMVSAHGQVYIHDGTNGVNIAVAGTYYPITFWSTNTPQDALPPVNVTQTPTGLVSLVDGAYQFSASVSKYGQDDALPEWGIFVNDVHQDVGEINHTTITVGATEVIVGASFTAQLELEAGDVVNLRGTSDVTGNYVFKQASMNLARLSPSVDALSVTEGQRMQSVFDGIQVDVGRPDLDLPYPDNPVYYGTYYDWTGNYDGTTVNSTNLVDWSPDRNDAAIVNNADVTFDGVDDELLFSADVPTNAGISSYSGTATLTLDVVNDKITSTAGSAGGIVITNAGSVWANLPCAENAGVVCYDVSGNGNHATATNVTLATFRSNTGTVAHNFNEGASKVLVLDRSKSWDIRYTNTLS